MGMYGGVEAGGTKFVCVVASGPGEIVAEERFPTTTPEETMGRVVDFFKRQKEFHNIQGLGVATFGPLDLNPVSPSYGHITITPKPGWSHADIAGWLSSELRIPVKIDTDVNGAALGEYRWGAGQGKDPFVYFTIGTGIGGGGIVHGKSLHGLVHPEMGHIRLPHDMNTDPFPGICPFHRDCFEGLASGPAIHARWGQPAEMLPEGHVAWDLEAHYLALAMVNVICILSPERIVLGGGVMQQPFLLPSVRRNVLDYLNEYVQSAILFDHIDTYLQTPTLGNQAGVLGAIALGMQDDL